MSTSVQFKTEVLGDDIQESQNRDKRPVPMTVEERRRPLGSRSICNKTYCQKKIVPALAVPLCCAVGAGVGVLLPILALGRNDSDLSSVLAISSIVGTAIGFCAGLPCAVLWYCWRNDCPEYCGSI